MPENGGNGHTRDYNLSVIETLVFPDHMSEQDREDVREQFRANPEYLDFLIDVQELREYLMATPGVLRETKEQFVAGLAHYIGEDGTAYAAMVGLYARELVAILPDVTGAHLLFERLENVRAFSINGP